MAAAVSRVSNAKTFSGGLYQLTDLTQDTLYEVMTLMVKKGPLSYMGAPAKESIEL